MTLTFFKRTTLIVSAAFLASCGGGSPSADEAVKRLIAGNEPAVIMSFEVKELLDKGGITSKENIPSIAQMMFSDKVEYLTSPEKIGLDLSGKTYIAILPTSNGVGGWSLAKIKDKESLEKTLKEEGYTKFEEVDGFNTINEGKEMVMGWNEGLLITCVNQSGDAKKEFEKLLGYLKEEKKVGEGFEKFLANKSDMAFMSNFDKMIDLQKNISSSLGGSMKEAEMMQKMMSKFKGSYNVFSVDFENDKIVSDMVNGLSAATKKEMDFFGKGGTPKEMLSQVGDDNALGFFAVNGDVKGYIEWLQNIVGEDILSDAKRETNMDVDQIVKSFKGSVLFSLLGYAKKEISFGTDPNGEEMKYSYNVPQYSLVTNLTNNYIQTLADSILKDSKKENYYQLGGNDASYLTFRDGYLFMSNKEELLINPVTNSNPSFVKTAASVMDKPMSFYFDLNGVISKADEGDMTQNIAKKFKYVFGGADINGGHAELHLNNGGKNSLWTLINLTVESTANMATGF